MMLGPFIFTLLVGVMNAHTALLAELLGFKYVSIDGQRVSDFILRKVVFNAAYTML